MFAADALPPATFGIVTTGWGADAPCRPVGGDEVSVGLPPSGTWPVPATAVARPAVTPPLDTAAATLLPAGDTQRTMPVGDVDGDGHDDLAAITSAGDVPEATEVWSGVELPLAAGTTAPAPALHPPAGSFLGPVPLDGRSALVVVTHRADGDAAYHELEVWVPEGGLTFTTAGAGPVATVQPIGGGTAPTQFQVLDDPGPGGPDRWLTATLQDRGQTQRWAWDLDTLCTTTPLTP